MNTLVTAGRVLLYGLGILFGLKFLIYIVKYPELVIRKLRANESTVVGILGLGSILLIGFGLNRYFESLEQSANCVEEVRMVKPTLKKDLIWCRKYLSIARTEKLDSVGEWEDRCERIKNGETVPLE